VITFSEDVDPKRQLACYSHLLYHFSCSEEHQKAELLQPKRNDMKRTNLLKNILLYLLMPEDTTEAGYRNNLTQNSELSGKLTWLGPLKTVLWVILAITGPLLLCTLLV
jgi:hypothetical protein